MGRALRPLALAALLAVLLVAVPAGAAVLTAQDRGREQLAPSADDGDRRRDQLEHAAVVVRKAWLAHDAATIVGGGQLVVQLPGADPSAAVGARQAAALLSDFLASSREVELKVRTAREVEPGQGYVEMVRRYHVEGTQDIRTQHLFLGYRRARQGWVLVELRAIAP